MARNKEKHVVGLNRIWLQTLDEENLKKNPPRPGLGSLRSAAEVRKWIPSIKKDIDFCLKQSQVGCYPDSHIEDFSTRIDGLTREYKAYIRKLRELEPQTDAVPWTDRPYKRKHKTVNDTETEGTEVEDKSGESQYKVTRTDFSAISAPVLEADDSYRDLYGYVGTSSQIPQSLPSATQNSPLVFINRNQLCIESPDPVDRTQDKIDIENKCADCGRSHELCNKCRQLVPGSRDQYCKTDEIDSSEKTGTEMKSEQNDLLKDSQAKEKSDCEIGGSDAKPSGNMRLYVPYSDSSSEEEETQE